MAFNPTQYYEYGKSRVVAPMIPSGLISYHSFNDNLLDSVGNNDGSGSPIYVIGNSGQAVDVSAGSPIELNNQTIGGTSVFSISCMFRAHSSGSNVIYGAWSAGSSILIWLNGSNLQAWLNTGSATNNTFFSGFSDFNVWKHLVFTYNGTEARMYLDGVEASSAWSKSGVVSVSGQPEAWGQGGSASNDFTGDIDGGGLWNKVLSQAEVTEIYNIQSSGNELL